jgi:hypothetical protein
MSQTANRISEDILAEMGGMKAKDSEVRQWKRILATVIQVH